MKFYFDRKNEVNLSHVDEIKNVRPYTQLENYYKKRQAEFVVSKDYNANGIYLVETSKLTHQWTNGPFDSAFSLINNIPYITRVGIQTGVLRLVILSIVEGDSFVKHNWDGFRALTDQVKGARFPKFSVLVVSGNVKVQEEYAKWCKDNNEQPYIEFIGGCEGPYATEVHRDWQDRIANSKARDQHDPYMFSSLNRAHRPHRTEHLFAIARLGLLNKGLVSGGMYFKQHGVGSPKYIETSPDTWRKFLLHNYPRTVDVDNLRELNPANDINLSIYENAILSIVTETFFEETGLFITEKTWKPISVGSPQMVLAQRGLATYINKKFGINIILPGLDQRYDTARDPTERFLLFHESLEAWCKMPFVLKHKLSVIWDEQLMRNQQILKDTDFKEVIVKDIIRSTNDYFLLDTNS